jgi:hypothetical protein
MKFILSIYSKKKRKIKKIGGYYFENEFKNEWKYVMPFLPLENYFSNMNNARKIFIRMLYVIL